MRSIYKNLSTYILKLKNTQKICVKLENFYIFLLKSKIQNFVLLSSLKSY